jgi:hypothetical protein
MLIRNWSNTVGEFGRLAIRVCVEWRFPLGNRRCRSVRTSCFHPCPLTPLASPAPHSVGAILTCSCATGAPHLVLSTETTPANVHEAIASARAPLDSKAGRQLHAKRQGIEGTISHGVRCFGLRQACYRAPAKTGLQNSQQRARNRWALLTFGATWVFARTFRSRNGEVQVAAFRLSTGTLTMVRSPGLLSL